MASNSDVGSETKVKVLETNTITTFPVIDHKHALFLHPSDTPGASLISEKLTCPETYGF